MPHHLLYVAGGWGYPAHRSRSIENISRYNEKEAKDLPRKSCVVLTRVKLPTPPMNGSVNGGGRVKSQDRLALVMWREIVNKVTGCRSLSDFERTCKKKCKCHRCKYLG